MGEYLEKDWKVIKGEISEACCPTSDGDATCSETDFHVLYFNNRADNIILKVCNTGSCTMNLNLLKKCGGVFTQNIIVPPGDTGKNCAVFVLDNIIQVELRCENGEQCCGCYEIQRNFLATKNHCDW